MEMRSEMEMRTKNLIMLMTVVSLLVVHTQPVVSVSSVIAQEAPVVVCTTTTLGAFVEAIAGDLVNVTTIVQPGVCPAHFDIKPSHVYAVSIASLVLYHGMEPWLANLVTASSNTDVQQVQVSGPWNTPQFGLSYAKRVTEVLMGVFPESNSTFIANNATLTESINQVGDDLQNEITALHPENYNVTCMAWQTSFVSWLGFAVVVTYPPEEDLSTSDVVEITAASAGNNCIMVIDNLQSGTSFGAELAQEIGATHVVLSNFPGAVPGTEEYPDLLSYNCEQMINALKTHIEQQGQIAELNEQLQAARNMNLALITIGLMLAVVVVVESALLFRQRGRP